MKTKIYELKTLICEDGKFCDATMNWFIILAFGGILINSIISLT
tara:strand:+ start:483 stop:614 length:132 start_codon:yes stop_codon:yes gene_type:complete